MVAQYDAISQWIDTASSNLITSNIITVNDNAIQTKIRKVLTQTVDTNLSLNQIY